MKNQGPRNIGIGSIKSYAFPITAISSILHRLTGVLMVVMLPFILLAFGESMGCRDGFYHIQNLLVHSPLSIFSWLFLSAISYHIIAGIRHLIMDFGFAEEMEQAKMTSVLVIILGAVITIGWGIWLWVI